MLVATVLLTACTSTGIRGTNRAVAEHQRQVARLEAELRSRDATIARALRELEVVSERSNAMGTTIDDVIREFDDYQRTVERVIRELSSGESPNETADKDTSIPY